ncbi:hypothetical protein [Paraburkholderia sp.]|uniref:hypothetical protein n=1 Tax=Paraburkholderia sp. TaxID=1926495 RepID=UPI0023A5DB86|nr:hypothetical protein [Paraburkholderia sp.]MDE1182203.1 hypothetical protein [Paraburkholderia sp.]
MQRVIEPRELGEVELDGFQSVRVFDGVTSVTIWEGPIPLGRLYVSSVRPSGLGDLAILIIAVDDVMDDIARRSICESLWPRIAARGGARGSGWVEGV